MHIDDLFPTGLLAEMIERGFVGTSRHNAHDLTIHNYTPAAQYGREWNEATSQCRGLIVADDGLVVARPFAKFFNYTEVPVPKHVLNSPPAAFDKLDGSLGIAYLTPDGWAVSTRGSFHSDQAEWATEWFRSNVLDFEPPDGVTTLFEIIYPSNRIVVDYGERAELVLLGAVDIDSGADIPLWEIGWWDGARTDHYPDVRDLDGAHAFASGNDKVADEGVVLAWYRPGEPSFRLKIKHPEYVRLHRLVTNTSSKTVWEVLRAGDDIEAMIADVPDEFYTWVQETVDKLTEAYDLIEATAQQDFAIVESDVGTDDRKAFALTARDSNYPGLLFAMLDGKDYSDTIWKMVKPDYERPFVDAGDDI
jgi:hypothetical protein